MRGEIFKSRDELVQKLDSIRADEKIVFTNGCFDLLHAGHVQYLADARLLGTRLVVGLNTDNSVQKLKGPQRPLQNESDRAIILSSLRSVDFVTFFDEETPELLIQGVRPAVLVKGGDYHLDQIVGAAFVQSYGGLVKSLKFHEGRSSSNIIAKMSK